MSIAAQLHFWPWSCFSSEETMVISSETCFPFYGSPVISLIEEASIVLPARHERFHPLGPAFKPPNSDSYCRLFESPHGTVFGDKKSESIHIRNKAGKEIVQEIIRLEPNKVMLRYDGKDEQGKPKDSLLSRVVEDWSSFFEDILKYEQHDNEKNSRIEWDAVQAYLEKIQANKQEPFRALIVDIAEEMHSHLPEIVRATRRALIRERQMMSANRVEETDIGCLRWYIRQPGRTMAEKAGPRQRLLAIARQETHNLHENRILKDFLLRCNHVGKRYIANAFVENPAYVTSTRVQCVRLLASLCVQLHLSPQLLDVTAPNPATPPNYVLLNDIRYRKVWYWYKRLLRQEQEKDCFWDWQARTWADIARLLISVAIRSLQKKCDGFKLTEIYQGSLRIREEQILGCRTAAGSETGPLLINRLSNQWVLEIVHQEQAEYHPIAKYLGATGGHLYLVLRPLGREVSPQVLIIWAVHTAASSSSFIPNDIGESAEKALTQHQSFLNMARIPFAPKLYGLPLVDAPDVKGGMEYHPEPIKGRFEIHEDSRKVDIVIARDGRHEDLLKPVSCTEILDSEVCRPADGLSIAGASLVRHFVRTADNCEKALQSVNRNQKIIREIILGSAIRYCRKFADTWYESGIENEIKSGIKSEKQLSLWSNDTNEQRTKETPFRLLSFPFSVPAPKTMPVDIHVRIRPASGMAHMEVKPEDTSFLHGRSVFVDYQTMRPCQVEELITDAKGWPPLEELTPHPAIGIWNGIDELVNEIEQTTPQTKIFTLRLQQMYDFLKTQKPYSFPDGSRVNLPVLNQNGLPGSQVGENLIARFSVALRIHTSKIRSWNTKEIRKMITRATWLYGATPDNVNNCIMNYIKYKTATGTTCEAGSRSLMDTSNIQAIFEYIAKDIRERNVFPMQNIRAIKNILSLRSNGQEALHGTTTTIFMNALLNEIDKPKYHYTPKFFTCLSLLLFLLRYRKCDEQFLPYDSGETNEIIVKLSYHLPFMKANMVEIRYKKSVEAINGIIDYLNFKGKTTLIDTLNFLSDNENNENDE